MLTHVACGIWCLISPQHQHIYEFRLSATVIFHVGFEAFLSNIKVNFDLLIFGVSHKSKWFEMFSGSQEKHPKLKVQTNEFCSKIQVETMNNKIKSNSLVFSMNWFSWIKILAKEPYYSGIQSFVWRTAAVAKQCCYPLLHMVSTKQIDKHERIWEFRLEIFE